MSPALQSLLFAVRQHAGFNELLRAVETPRLPRYSPRDTLETMGARSAFASGQLKQHEMWLAVLTGEAPRGDNTSDKE